MALIREFVRRDFDRPSLHKAIPAQYSVFERDGRSLIQISTFGSDDRELVGKMSQTIQPDQTSAEALRRIIDEAFPR